MRKRWIAGAALLAGLTALGATAATPEARRLARARRLLARMALVDGVGSGLDADLLQGRPPAGFADAGHLHPDLAPASHGHAGLASVDHAHPDLEGRTQCMRVVGDVIVFDGC